MSATEVAILQKIISDLATRPVSDLILKAGNQPIIRRDGDLETLTGEPVVTTDLLEAVVDFFLTPEQREALQEKRQLTFGFTFAGRLRLRVTIFYQKGLPEVTIRFVPSTIKELAAYGLPAVVSDVVLAEHGFMLVCGPFGSGRTTTMAACVEHINRNKVKHIVSLEEPIEHMFVSDQSIIDQREIGVDVPTWEDAVSSLPQEDCDVVLLSRIPSYKVLQEALALSLGGKLVIAALESESTTVCLEQLVALGTPTEQAALQARLSEALILGLMQKLVPRVGGGRVLVPEVLLGTPAVKALIRDGKYYQIRNLLQTSRAEGMVSFDYALAQFVKTGEILREVAEVHALDVEQFTALARR